MTWGSLLLWSETGVRSLLADIRTLASNERLRFISGRPLPGSRIYYSGTRTHPLYGRLSVETNADHPLTLDFPPHGVRVIRAQADGFLVK